LGKYDKVELILQPYEYRQVEGYNSIFFKKILEIP